MDWRIEQDGMTVASGNAEAATPKRKRRSERPRATPSCMLRTVRRSRCITGLEGVGSSSPMLRSSAIAILVPEDGDAKQAPLASSAGRQASP